MKDFFSFLSEIMGLDPSWSISTATCSIYISDNSITALANPHRDKANLCFKCFVNLTVSLATDIIFIKALTLCLNKVSQIVDAPNQPCVGRRKRPRPAPGMNLIPWA